nr:hypothetical protein [Streptomyces sp. NRRL F-5053]
MAGLPGPAWGAGDPGQRGQRGDAHRHVDEEDGAPAEPEDVGRQQPAAEQLAADGTAAHHGAGQRERLATGIAREEGLRRAVRLRDDQRRAQPLHQTGRHEGPGGGGEAAAERGRREQRRADAEDTERADVVSEAAARDEAQAVHQLVSGQDELLLSLVRVESALDGGHGHDHDEHIEVGEEGAGEHDGERRSLTHNAPSLALRVRSTAESVSLLFGSSRRNSARPRRRRPGSGRAVGPARARGTAVREAPGGPP